MRLSSSGPRFQVEPNETQDIRPVRASAPKATGVAQGEVRGTDGSQMLPKPPATLQPGRTTSAGGVRTERARWNGTGHVKFANSEEN